MQKMTVVALPKTMVDSLKNNQTETGLLNKFSFRLKIKSQGTLFLYFIAFLLGRLIFLGDLAPFGLGFFAAVAQVVPRKNWGAALAVLIGVVSSGHYDALAVYVFVIGAYLKVTPRFTRLEKKMFIIPMMMFLLVVFSGTIFQFMRDASLFGYLTVGFNALLCMAASQLFVYGIPLFFQETFLKDESRIGGDERVICLVVILALAVAGIGQVSLGGYQVQNIVSSVIVMAMALYGGTGQGAAVGVIVGMVIGLSGSGESEAVIALYAVGGTLAGVFKPLGKFAVVLAFLFGSLLVHLSFTQIPLLLSSLAEVSIAAILATMLPSISLFRSITTSSTMSIQPSALVDNAEMKLRSVAGLFYEISSLLHLQTKSDGVQDEVSINRLLGAVGKEVCETCVKRSVCWEENYYRTYQSMLALFHRLADTDDNRTQVREAFDKNCCQAEKVFTEIKRLAETSRISTYWEKKLYEQKWVMGEQLKAAGNIFVNVAQELIRPFTDHARHVKYLLRKIEKTGMSIDNIRISGGDHPRFIEFETVACGKKGACVSQAMPIVSDYLQERITLTRECGNRKSGEKCRITMTVATPYSISVAAGSAVKDGKTVCGDSIKITNLKGGKVSLLLSDGMGSGTVAAKESKLTVDCLSKLLEHDFDINAAVKMVNSLLLLKAGEDNFATVDMVLVDKYTGDAEFLKVASAPSFIKRVHEVGTICAKALPIGILNHVEIEPVKISLAVNDILVMVSDGIYDVGRIKAHSSDKDGWLVNFIRRNTMEDEQEFADAILAEALRLGGGSASDDMSVLVMRLREGSFLE